MPSPANDQPTAVGVTTTLPMPKARMALRVCATSSALITGPRQRSHSALSATITLKGKAVVYYDIISHDDREKVGATKLK